MDASTLTKTLRTGSEMPVIGLGTWQLTGDKATDIVKLAIDLGYRMFDTSGDYNNQGRVGAGIKQGHVAREEIYLVTKVEENEDSYQSTKDDLRELDLSYADLMLIHRPPRRGAGVEIWEGLIKARQEGLTRDIGVSNYSIEEMEELSNATGEVPVVNQIEWSPYGHSKEMLDYCQENHIIIMAYSPLTRQQRLDDDNLDEIADKYGKTPAQVMIRWNIQQGVVPIPKASQTEHVEENFDVFDFELSGKDMIKLNNMNEFYSSLGSLAYV
jgi:2,5-diketo-D-gluconate reductase A